MASSITKEDLIKTDPNLKNRYYQVDALLSIFLYVKCLVKMFCGTGKSRIITNVIIHEKKELNVVVFPSLALIQQYSADYLENDEYKHHFKKHKTLNVSSECLTTIDSTTNPKEIKKFLKLKSPKIIMVTYQSFQVLLDCLEGKKIGLVCYDEAHHVVSPEYQKLIFGTDYFEKEVFFTATPRNENGITMFDRDEPEKNMCGELAYEYTYLQGLKDEFLNLFKICIDMYTDDNNSSMYEAIARAILSRNTSRVLIFHSGVNGESNTSVWNFVNLDAFQTAFNKVQKNEFPKKEGEEDYYKKITFQGMDGNTPSSERKKMLKELDETPDNEIYIISSCETIGEGVDTKKANMCVFADPKTSVTKIIQNIGRVVRPNKDCPCSTILIPCFVDMEHYAEANGDKEKIDELIRQQMRATNGDYAPILNVLAALKQEDPELYEACLNYPNRRHKETSLNEQGYKIMDEDEDEYCETYTPEEVNEIKEGGETPLEIHTDETIERFNEEVEDEPLLRLYHDQEEDVYKPIVRIDDDEDDEDGEYDNEDQNTNDDRQIIQPPNPNKQVRMSFHENSDIQMIWGVTSELDFSKKFCSVVIDCEVIKIDPMDIAIKIVQWYNENDKRIPLNIHNPKNESEKIEAKHAYKLGEWKKALKGTSKSRCSDKVRDYLDKEIPIWRDDIDEKAMNNAQDIVKWYKDNKRFPSNITKPSNEAEKIEKKYAIKVWMWKLALKGTGSCRCSYEVQDYLDKKMPGWRDERDLDEKAINDARDIVQWYNDNDKQMPRRITNPKNEAEEIGIKHAQKLGNWIKALKGKGKGRCSDAVRDYLDTEIPRWRDERDLDKNAMNQARDIVKWYNANNKRLPREIRKSENEYEIIEAKHARKLGRWKKALKGKGDCRCSDPVRDYLDKELPGWRPIQKTLPTQESNEELPTTIKIKPTKKKLVVKKNNKLQLSGSEKEKENNDIVVPHHIPKTSEIGKLHKTYLRMRSDTLHQKFKTDPELWREYHATRKRTFASYEPDSIPSNRIIKELEQIKTKRRKIVVDMGCGEAPIAHYFKAKNDTRFLFHNYDHQSGGDEMINEIDISALPLDDNSAEIAIMSLALWGTDENCTQYIKEAYRVLESDGKFYISDSTKKWSPENITQENAGDKLRTLLTTNGFKIIKEDIGTPFCYFECIKI